MFRDHPSEESLPDPSILLMDVISGCDPEGNCREVVFSPGSSEGTTVTLDLGYVGTLKSIVGLSRMIVFV
jgi:hypothetical protein